ncbi:TPA: DUF1643 domain-containing protein [Morganella morganii]
MKTKDAYISNDGKYRYDLWRLWDESKPKIMFIGLNPSTADQEIDDSTITRCIDFSVKWGFGGLIMCNLFAFRATKPKEMLNASEPVGIETDMVLLERAKEVDVIVAAWGNDGGFMGRSGSMLSLLSDNLLSDKLYYLKLNKTGEPRHPLYIHGETKLTKWQHIKL